MEKWRFLDINWITYAETAIQRIVSLRAKSEGIIPDTVCFYSFPRPSLSLNYFNDPDKDINLELCRKHGIQVLRIVSGGGPIFGDTGFVGLGICLDRGNPKAPPTVEEMLKKTLTGVAEGVSKTFGVKARFKPLNDVEILGKDGVWRKVGPSACIYGQKAILMGSALQVKKPPIDLIEKVIVPPPEKFMDKDTKSVRERMTWLEREVEREVSIDEVKEMYMEVVKQTFNVELVPGELTEKEKEYYEEIRKLVTSDEFFYDRSERRFGKIPPDVKRSEVRTKIPEGPFIRVVVLVKDGIIKDVLITGTLHASPLIPSSPIHEIEKSLRGVKIDRNLIKEKIEEVYRKPGFQIPKVSPDNFVDLIMKAAEEAGST